MITSRCPCLKQVERQICFEVFIRVGIVILVSKINAQLSLFGLHKLASSCFCQLQKCQSELADNQRMLSSKLPLLQDNIYLGVKPIYYAL